MKYYEILYIVNPNLEQNRLAEIKKEVADELTKLMPAEIINHRIFGKKRLAYQIDKHKYGTYMLLHLGTPDSTQMAEVNTFLKLNKAIIRHLIVRLDVRPEEDLTPESVTLEDSDIPSIIVEPEEQEPETDSDDQLAEEESETTADDADVETDDEDVAVTDSEAGETAAPGDEEQS
ncbi:MAG: 30S ribosomal protein S6 [Candidatus Neomarinimicrobiota bacterium]